MAKFERIEIPSQIPNTKTIGIYKDGVLVWYEITPITGYVLHNNARDYTEIDENTGEHKKRLGYGVTPSSCPSNYDFTPVTITDEKGRAFTAYGKFELAARLNYDV